MSGYWKFDSATVMILFLGACGGGGGQGVSSVPPPLVPTGQTSLPDTIPKPVTPPSNEDFDTVEFRNSSAAVGSKAIGAWQQGATGKGITIGFVDTGLVPTLSDFSGRLDPESRDVEGNRPMGDVYGHGTAIAGIAAAARDANGMQGIAFESTIFMAKADQGCPTNCGFSSDAIAAGIDAARVAGARVINLSIGGSGSSEVWSAANRAFNAGIIIVVAAGNSGSAPTDMASKLASLAPDQVIIVGGLGVSNEDGTINFDVPSIYTSQAGASQSSFLAAPGWLNSATYLFGGIDRLSGTSFAAPVVSGAVALIAEAFPMLTPKQIVMLLYLAADDIGATGIDSTFGHGRLNIGRAFEPVGTTRLANSLISIPDSIGKLPSAAGDAARRGTLLATVLDDFDRPFDHDFAASFQESRPAGPLMQSLVTGQRSSASNFGRVALAFTVDHAGMRTLASEKQGLSQQEKHAAELLAASAVTRLSPGSFLAFGFGTDSSTLRAQLARPNATGFLLTGNSTGRLGFDVRNLSSTVFEQRFGRWTISIAGERGTVRTYEPFQSAPGFTRVGLSGDRQVALGTLHVGLSRLVESRTLLGGWTNSLFGRPGSKTWIADAEFEQRLSRGWSLKGAFRGGHTTFSNGQINSQINTSEFSFDVAKIGVLNQKNILAFRVYQPTRVESGSIGIVLPISWSYVSHESTEALRQLTLEPSGRELSVEAGYLINLPKGWLSLNAYGRRNPGHVKQSASDFGVAIRTDLKL